MLILRIDIARRQAECTVSFPCFVLRMGIQSAEFYRELEQFLQDKTEIFVRELLSYAKSPFDIRGYDSACVYESQGQPVAVPGATQRALRGERTSGVCLWLPAVFRTLC